MAKRRILVAVTGMSPQIVTETVYALHQEYDWLPEKIILLTTLAGKNQIVQQLLGEDGYFGRLCAEYGLPEIEFGEETIKVICEQGVELADIRTEAQNNAAADLIVREIYQLCQDDETELHVSIAGGRKSMGFYVGYALSLFGRVQDKMSHVLVEEDFEQNREFFYPPKHKHLLNTKNGMLDAAQAKVMLAEIPFVRMATAKHKFQFDGQMTFSQAVRKTQALLSGYKIFIYQEDRSICVQSLGTDVVLGTVKLQQKQMALYLAMLAFCQHDAAKVEMDNPHHIEQFSQYYLAYYQQYKPELRKNSQAAQMAREQLLHTLIELNSSTGKVKILEELQEHGSRIRSALVKALGDYGADLAIQSDGENNAKRYFVDLDWEHLLIES